MKSTAHAAVRRALGPTWPALTLLLASSAPVAGTPVAYVVHASTPGLVTAIDATTKRVVRSIPVGDAPQGVAISNDGRQVYVANSASSSISVISTRSNTVTDTIIVGPPAEDEPPFVPRQLAVAADGGVWVSLDFPDGCPMESSLGRIDPARNEIRVMGVLEGESTVEGFAFAPDRALYAAMAGGCSDYFFYAGLAAIDPGAYRLERGLLTLRERRDRIATGDIVTRDLTAAYVAITGADVVAAVDLASLRRFDAMTSAIAVGVQPVGLALSRTGEQLFVVNRCGAEPSCAGEGTVSIVDTGRGAVIETLAVGRRPQHIALSPHGRRAYVTNSGSATVSVIDTVFDRVQPNPIAVAGAPSAIAIADVPAVVCTDCSGDGSVAVDDLLTMVAVALGNSMISDCRAGDADGNGRIDINDIVAGIDAALNGCSAPQ